MNKTRCPHCGRVLRAHAEEIENRRRCPACHHVVTAPADEGEPQRAASPEARARPRRRKKAGKPTGRPAWLPWALVGGAAAVVLGCVVPLVAGLGWLISRAGGGRAAEAAAAREPEHKQPTSWVTPVPLASADSATWKVKVDEPPARTGLPSAYPIPPGAVESFAFAPRAGQVGVVLRPQGGTGFEWVRYDLGKSEPAGRVPLGDAKRPEEALRPNNDHYSGAAVSALSPSGDRLAVRDGHGAFFGVWARDGRRLGTVRVEAAPQATPWAGFGGEDRLWVLNKKQLTLREIASGKVLVTVPGEMWASPALTPGGKWLAACAGKELMFFDAVSGARAGTVALPDGWGGADLAAHPSGRSMAVQLVNQRSDVLLGVWDLATGHLTDSLAQTYYLSQQKLTPGLQWAGPRQLLCNHALVDHDRHVILTNEYVPAGQCGSSGLVSPDGRQWLVRTFSNDEWPRVGKKLPRLSGPATRTYLTAASLPKAVTGPLEAAAEAFLWHPGVAVRVVAADEVPRKYRARVAEAAADFLAQEGYRVDPGASITVEALVKLGKPKSGVGRRMRREELSDAQKQQLRFNPMMDFYEITDAYDASIQGKVYDASGRLAMQTESFLVQPSVKRGAGDDAAWEKMLSGAINLHPPRLYLRDANHQRLLLPKSYRPGVDGVLEPVLETIKTPYKDGYSLPEDG
jgi:hypothetical protein